MRIHIALAAAAALLVAGCGSKEEAAPAAETPEAGAASMPEAAPVDTTEAAAPAEDVMPAAVEEKVAKAPAAKTIPVRGKGSIEEKCLKAVAKQANNPGVGVNRIEESEAAIEVYINLDGAAAPWKCLAYRDGTIGEVSFTGSEGDL